MSCRPVLIYSGELSKGLLEDEFFAANLDLGTAFSGRQYILSPEETSTSDCAELPDCGCTTEGRGRRSVGGHTPTHRRATYVWLPQDRRVLNRECAKSGLPRLNHKRLGRGDRNAAQEPGVHVAVVDQYATSVSFAHSLPCFSWAPSTLLGRWRFPGTGGLHGQSGISSVGYIGLVLRNSTGFGPARPVPARGSRWRHHYTTSVCRPFCRP